MLNQTTEEPDKKDPSERQNATGKKLNNTPNKQI